MVSQLSFTSPTAQCLRSLNLPAVSALPQGRSSQLRTAQALFSPGSQSLATTQISASQRTVDSAVTGIKCAGLQQEVVLTIEDGDNLRFEKWWNTTRWALDHGPDIKGRPTHRITWKRDNYRSAGWEYYKQGAEYGTGNPKIVCNCCKAVLVHPSINGTNAMCNHLKSKACKNASNRSTEGRRIEQTLDVSLNFIRVLYA